MTMTPDSIGEQQRATTALGAEQQAALHTLSLRAIAAVPLDDLYALAVELVHDALGGDFVYVVQVRDGDELVVRAHAGRTDMNPVGRVVQARGSIADFVIRANQPVITEDFASETRFAPPPAVQEVSARSAAAVPVQGRHGPFGSLVVMKRATDAFDAHDVAFMESAAELLAAAVDRSADTSALRRQRELFLAITEYGRELVAILDGEGRITYMSPSGARILATDAKSLVQRHILDVVHEDDRAQVIAALGEATREANAMRAFGVRARKGADEWIRIAGTAYNMLHHPAVRGIVINARDVTETLEAQDALHRSQEQLHQALKMEAVGRLAGGIAHDFNNLLTAIRGYSDMVAAGLRSGDPLRGDVEEIQRAADRAASLTHQLLAFSRRQVLRPDQTNLGYVVRDLDGMIRRVIGEDVDLRVQTDVRRTVLVDRGQIEQVILNLVINARDAMPSGGTLIIDAADHDAPPTVQAVEHAPPGGRYVLIRVADSGTGIPREIVNRIFEPFFTTKPAGKGTGLGLSTAYGTVKQSGGFIYIDSVEGGGTTVRVYLPEAEAPADAQGATSRPEAELARRHGGETILLVEDADAVRQVVRRALVRMGYRVFEASNGPQAIGVALEHRDEIDLLLTDFVMPHMGGRELIDRLRELGMRHRILIMSGYIDDALLRGGGFPPDASFIEKPFTAESLGRKVREVLDGVAPHSHPTAY